MIKFNSYTARCNIKASEVSIDLYRFCETPLEQKLIASNSVLDDIKSTPSEVMKNKIKRLCRVRTRPSVTSRLG